MICKHNFSVRANKQKIIDLYYSDPTIYVCGTPVTNFVDVLLYNVLNLKIN